VWRCDNNISPIELHSDGINGRTLTKWTSTNSQDYGNITQPGFLNLIIGPVAHAVCDWKNAAQSPAAKQCQTPVSFSIQPRAQ